MKRVLLVFGLLIVWRLVDALITRLQTASFQEDCNRHTKNEGSQ